MDITPPCNIAEPAAGWCPSLTSPPTQTPAPVSSIGPASLACASTATQVTVGQVASFSAVGGTGSYTWSAPGGVSASEGGTPFNVLYAVPGFKTITVVSGNNQATCTMTVVASATISSSLVCSPVNQNAVSGQPVTVKATGGVPQYAWSAPGGSPPGARSGTSFTTMFLTPSDASRIFPITVADSAGASATCNVTISCPAPYCPKPLPGCSYQNGNTCSCGILVCPSTSASPTPTPSPTASPTVPALTMQKTVRNITQNGGEADSVSANPSDTVEFSIRVSSVGSGPATDVVVRDTLPSGLTYQSGTTTIDTIPATDGIIATGLNLGTLQSGRTVIIRFRATVAPESYFNVGTSTLVNTVYARASNVPETSDGAFVNVIRNPQSVSMSLTKLGRNTSRGQTGEYSSVSASPTETIEFILRVHNASLATLHNVVVRDIVPQGITAIAGTARLNGQPVADILVSSGVNIGSLVAGQEAVVNFSGRTAAASGLPTGTTTLINTAQTSADGVPMLYAQMPIMISNPANPGTVSTGPGESTLLALIISAIITLLYVGYASTDSYRRREAGGLARQAKGDKGRFDFRN